MDPAAPAAPEAPAAVQADPAQGGDPGGAPYAEFLDRFPEEHRAVAEPIFRAWDAQTTQKFQDHASFRDQWTPYAETGIDRFDPNDVARLVEFAELVSDPDAYQAFLMQQAIEAGWVSPEFDPAAIGGGGLDPGVADAVTQALAPMQQTVEQLAAWQQQQTQAAAEEQAQAAYAQAYADLQAQHGEVPADLIERFAAAHLGKGLSEREVIDRAFADYQAFVAQVETGVFRRKLGQPATPQTGGTPPPPDTTPQTMDQAHEAALAHLRASRP